MVLMNANTGQRTTRLRDKLPWKRMENCCIFEIGSALFILHINDGTGVVM